MEKITNYITEKLNLNNVKDKIEEYDIEDISNVIHKCLASNFKNLSYDVEIKSYNHINVKLINIKPTFEFMKGIRDTLLDEINKKYNKKIASKEDSFITQKEIWLRFDI